MMFYSSSISRYNSNFNNYNDQSVIFVNRLGLNYPEVYSTLVYTCRSRLEIITDVET